LVAEGSNPFELSVATEIFGMARPELDVEWYRFLVCAPAATVRARDALFDLVVPGSMADVARADTVIVPNRPDATVATSPAVLRAVRRAAARGARVVSFCTGSFVLARAGLLDGRSATCHWRWAEVFRAEFPAVDLRPDVLYVQDGSVWTSAGSAAALDLSLALVENDHGSAVAHEVSKRLVFAMHRDGGQRQFVEPTRIITADGGCAPSHEIAAVMQWAQRHLADEIEVHHLAARCNVAVSTFHRWFRDSTGTTPLQWLRRERVTAALRWLETTDRSVDRIAQMAGLGTAANLRVLVRARTGLSPVAYRHSYRRT
jgi:AraC family transcriptional regulator, transcriptional activator FtrA